MQMVDDLCNLDEGLGSISEKDYGLKNKENALGSYL